MPDFMTLETNLGAAGPEASATEPILHSETMYRELEEKYKEDPRWQVCATCD